MDEDQIRQLLEQLTAGEITEDAVVERLKTLPFEDLEFAKIDHHRSLRSGFPEVIFGQGKTPEQVAAIFERLSLQSPVVMATRASPEQAEAVRMLVAGSVYLPVPRLITWRKEGLLPAVTEPQVAVISAGTSDIPVAEEAAVTIEMAGCCVDRVYDVGVAGIHRLLANLPRLTTVKVVVAVAGMEGALASVVGGLVSAPVIAVPTSVGYGASFGGLAALLGMLNSCAAGVAVVNIDNGFGAGILAAKIAKM